MKTSQRTNNRSGQTAIWRPLRPDRDNRREWTYVLRNEPDDIEAFIDHHLEECGATWDEASREQVRLALQEAVVNAMYHGNLELSSRLCEIDASAYETLARHRRRQEPYARRRIEVHVDADDAKVVYKIRDEGRGFQPARLPDPTADENLERLSGRGLQLIRSFMDHVRHNAQGTEITMVKCRSCWAA